MQELAMNLILLKMNLVNESCNEQCVSRRHTISLLLISFIDSGSLYLLKPLTLNHL
jgi:hypothetical protein